MARQLSPEAQARLAAARAVARSGPITVLYKPPRLPAVRRLVETGRESPGVRPVPASASGVRGLLRALKRADASVVSPIGFVQLPIIAVLGWLVFGEVVGIATAIAIDRYQQ
jgi:hypothetical protein